MRIVIYLLIPAMFLVSCSRAPEPVDYKYSTQKKMQASYHWQVLATDVANEINNALILNDYMGSAVFVRETCGDENTPCDSLETTTFDESFRDLLVTSLVNLGVPTSPTPGKEAITINYKTQTVYHAHKPLRTLRPGMLTALTAGILVFKNAPSEIIALALAGALDFANAAYVSQSNFEVIITTSMIAKNHYLYHSSNIYYINDSDSWHYQKPAAPTEISLTSAAPVAPSVPSSVPPSATQPPPVIVEEPQPIIPLSFKSKTTGI